MEDLKQKTLDELYDLCHEKEHRIQMLKLEKDFLHKRIGELLGYIDRLEKERFQRINTKSLIKR